MHGAVLRIKVSTKCIKYAEAVEQQHNQTASLGSGSSASDSHNRLLSRLNYWFAPSASAFVDETQRISTATAYLEVLSYTKLIVLHMTNYLEHVRSLEPNAMLGEPLHDITSSRSLISAGISNLVNIIGMPAVGAIGLHNASTTVSYCLSYS